MIPIICFLKHCLLKYTIGEVDASKQELSRKHAPVWTTKKKKKVKRRKRVNPDLDLQQ